MTILVTGGNGFIGTNFILNYLSESDEEIINVDSLTYSSCGYTFPNRVKSYVKNINDSDSIDYILKKYKPRAIVHFAAESHVDNSINDPEIFIKTNVLGTFTLLESVRKNLKECRFLHVSTDEVYGSLEPEDEPSTENSTYKPNSPYSASKASSDHIVRSYNKTYGLDTIITNCSNNYGFFQHDEKFIPTVIRSCYNQKPIPIYGDGKQIRDWLHVSDHCSALRLILEKGKSGEKYNIGGDNQLKNIDVVEEICTIFNEIYPERFDHKKLISFVKDRPGHDTRYDIDSSKLQTELGWSQEVQFRQGLKDTIEWYISEWDE